MRAIAIFALLAQLQLCLTSSYGPSWYKCTEKNCPLSSGCVCASLDPPGALPPSRTPQFILLTHDDTVHPTSTANIDFLTNGLTHSNGCRIPATFFVMTNGSDPGEIRRRWALGDEIGAHARDHLDQNDPAVGSKGRRSEIIGARDWVVAQTGLPVEAVRGYRTPLLAESVEQRQLLAEAGFLYDSSIVESIKVSTGVERRLWPYRMDAGIPQNRHRIKKGTEDEETWPGLWEIPVWVLLHKGQRYCMDPGRGGEGNDAEGDPYEILKSNLDAAYDGNRAPIPFYIHVFWFNGEREKRGRKFVEYAMSKHGVYFVTIQTLVAWMQDPVPVEEMGAWLQERCRGPKGVEIKDAVDSAENRGDNTRSTGRENNGKVKVARGREQSAATAGLVAVTEGGLSSGSLALAAGSVVTVTVILARRRRARRAGKQLR